MIDSHPALKCVSPQAPVSDWFIGDDFHHNGALFLSDAFGFLHSFEQKLDDPKREKRQTVRFQNARRLRVLSRPGPAARTRTRSTSRARSRSGTISWPTPITTSGGKLEPMVRI